MIKFVVPGGGGDRLGLKAGDVMLKIDGREIVTASDAEAGFRDRTIGSRIELTVSRSGQATTLAGRYETLMTDEEIIRQVRRQADSGADAAQQCLGELLATGAFTTKDESEAVRWFRKAAEAKNADAQFDLGLMYESGLGVLKDDAQAHDWFRKAADQGNSDAQLVLGLIYQNGRGVDEGRCSGRRLVSEGRRPG